MSELTEPKESNNRNEIFDKAEADFQKPKYENGHVAEERLYSRLPGEIKNPHTQAPLYDSLPPSYKKVIFFTDY